VLLEDCAVAVVPHGPLLVQQLTQSATPRHVKALLAVGAVDYNRPADPVGRPPDEVPTPRPVERSGRAGTWSALPGTVGELERLLAVVKALPEPLAVIERRGAGAGSLQVWQDLPKARVAHLARHGYFAAPQTQERAHLYDPGAFAMSGRQRVGVAVRNPLVQVGLVLAGANRPAKEGEPAGILTGEAIAGLPLDGMELAVLSACESGRGEENVGEGVYGLQRAFHLAGCKNVVASLWKVDDEATAALMAVFYHQLWIEKQPPQEALRRAQLALLRNPADVPILARGRGPDFDETVQRVGRPAAAKGERSKTSPVKHWAAFVLSGAGR
jgi:CHAT domain-containing protein